MNTKGEIIARELTQRYKTDRPTTHHIHCEFNRDANYLFLAASARKRRTKFTVVDIQPIDSDTVVSMWVDIDPNTIRRHHFKMDLQPQLGVFKIHFSDESFLYCARYVEGEGDIGDIFQITVAEQSVWHNWLKLVYSEQKRRTAIPKGISNVRWTHHEGTVYTKIKRIATFPAIHPEFESLKADISFFFAHVEQFTRYDQPGVRKALLVGPPGTGKTSMCLELARDLSDTMPVIFSTDIKACAAHLQIAARQGKATLAVLEDADSSLHEASSDVLNFLDGINQPSNTAGSFVLMTTNFPERIEPRILQRPGRIDRVYQVGELNDMHALRCARLYFPEDLDIADAALMQVVTGLTGAQIKELAQSSISYAVSSCQSLTMDLIQAVKARIAEDLRQIYKYADTQSPMTTQHNIGFVTSKNGRYRRPYPDDFSYASPEEKLPF
ncbi:MAG: hypothetical protein GFH27_549311n78 [Chloroflexi bacterium AL-W]|nr:hypothetical protein [Chloroflexi bacterium AL-N1]NOK68744.1 hypothetical protein [Chloroflexi bacterium AL-N10]NOK76230.1 hypothetical protein [Chloroflexi bacterium AL-N5]NOK84133.1 hypothetical protein [Chloroflexi bacterium AL-W]NOK91368.1 hypothetical protein [Chloroflexi bacterium AL-N15]